MSTKKKTLRPLVTRKQGQKEDAATGIKNNIPKQPASGSAAKRHQTPRQRMIVKLKESGLDEKDSKALGFDPKTELESTYLKLSRSGDGFKIPYYTIDRTLIDNMFRYRFFEALSGFLKGAEVNKYEQPLGSVPRAYFPHLNGINWKEIIEDASHPLVLTEGELKAACAVKMGFAAIGLGGIFNFQSKRLLWDFIPDLEQIKWKGRPVHICYDADPTAKEATLQNVAIAEHQLARRLTDRGAHVKIVQLPMLSPDHKTALDDFLVAKGVEALEQLFLHSYEYAETKEFFFLNTEVAYVHKPSEIIIYPHTSKNRSDEPLIVTVDKFKNEHYAPLRRHITVEDESKERPAAKDWVEWPGRSEYQSECYKPGQGREVDGNYNLWPGMGVEPEEGNVEPFLEQWDALTYGATSENAKWFLGYIACPIQNPGTKLQTAAILTSTQQGMGKNLFTETQRGIYGKANCGIITSKTLSKDFNYSWLYRKQIIFGNEILSSDRLEHMDILKDLITNPTQMVSRKFIDDFEADVCANFLLTSNHPNALLLMDNDRRWFVHEVTKQLPKATYDAYGKWKRDPKNLAAVHWWLRQVNLEDFNPLSHAPQTEARQEMERYTGDYVKFVLNDLKQHPDNRLRIGNVIVPYKLWRTTDLITVLFDRDEVQRYKINEQSLGMRMKAMQFEKAAKGQSVPTKEGMRNLWNLRNADLKGRSKAQIGKLYDTERKAGRKYAPSAGNDKKQ